MVVLKYLLLAPVAALILYFCYANRQEVTIYFDPSGVSGLKPLPAPFYAALLVAMALGVVIGGVSAWLGQSRHRRAAREAREEVARLRGELQAQRLVAAPAIVRPS